MTPSAKPDQGMRTLALALFVATLAVTAIGVILFAAFIEAPVPSGSWGIRGFFVVYAIEGAILGVLITTSRPSNLIGWVVATVGALWAIAFAAQQYALSAEMSGGSLLPGVAWAAWLVSWTYLPAVVLTGGFLLLLFPNGRLPSPRWRSIAWLLGVASAALIVANWIAPGPFVESPSIVNPTGIREFGPFAFTTSVGPLFLLGPLMVASVVSVVRRWRRSDGEERQQIKWLALAGAVLVAVMPLVPIFGRWGQAAFQMGLTLIYLGVGVAVLRYGLYQIDLVIRRTFVFGALTAVMAGLYSASIRLFTALFTSVTGETSDAALVITTLILATTFTPLRQRLERIADRWFKAPSPPSEIPATVEELETLVRGWIKEEHGSRRR